MRKVLLFAPALALIASCSAGLYSIKQATEGVQEIGVLYVPGKIATRRNPNRTVPAPKDFEALQEPVAAALREQYPNQRVRILKLPELQLPSFVTRISNQPATVPDYSKIDTPLTFLVTADATYEIIDTRIEGGKTPELGIHVAVLTKVIEDGDLNSELGRKWVAESYEKTALPSAVSEKDLDSLQRTIRPEKLLTDELKQKTRDGTLSYLQEIAAATPDD